MFPIRPLSPREESHGEIVHVSLKMTRCVSSKFIIQPAVPVILEGSSSALLLI